MYRLLFTAVFLLPLLSYCQDETKSRAGDFELGTRSTFSTFGSTGNLGQGFGGQFRIRASNRINTEWFADFLSEDIGGLGKRNDYHIGWSVMFYPFDPVNKKVTPYLLAGHCFDYTKITPTGLNINESGTSRLSSATQMGIGTQFYITEQFNLSVSSQYMIHLGQDVHTEVHNENGYEVLHIDKGNHGEHVSLEGHILFTISLNYKIADLW
jgi:hypothetical protein